MSQQSSRRRRIVGVVIDGDVLRGVELRRRVRRFRAKRVAEVVLPASARGTDTTLDVDTIAQALRDLWSTGKFKTKHVAFGVGGRDATIRPMTIPRAAAHDVAGYVRYQMADYLSYELDEAVIDHQLVDGGEGDEPIEVLAIGVSAALVESIGDAVEQAGLDLRAIDAAPSALAATIDTDPDDEGDAVVAVGGSRTTVVLRAAGTPRMVRVLAAGGGDHRTQLAEELDSMIARVEGRQEETNAITTGGAQNRRFSEAADAVAAAINYDLREHTGTGVDHVILTGAFGRNDSLHHLVTAASGVPVTAAATPSWWPEGGGSGFDDFDHYVEPAGLAFAALAKGSADFDLMPPSIIKARLDRRELGLGMALAGVLATALLVTAGPYREDADQASADVTAFEADVALLDARVDSLALVGELDAARSDQREALEVALRADLWWARVLEDIATATPGETFLTSMALERPDGSEDGGIADFSGVSSDQGAVGHWLDAMADLHVFEDVWLIQSTAGVLGEREVPVVTFRAQARLTPEARGLRAVDPAGWYLDGEVTS